MHRLHGLEAPSRTSDPTSTDTQTQPGKPEGWTRMGGQVMGTLFQDSWRLYDVKKKAADLGKKKKRRSSLEAVKLKLQLRDFFLTWKKKRETSGRVQPHGPTSELVSNELLFFNLPAEREWWVSERLRGDVRPKRLAIVSQAQNKITNFHFSPTRYRSTFLDRPSRGKTFTAEEGKRERDWKNTEFQIFSATNPLRFQSYTLLN